MAFFFAIGISFPFSSIHLASTDHPQQMTADGEGNKQASPSAGPPERVIPLLPLGMLDVATYDHWLVEKDVFSFFRGDAVPIPILRSIRFIPFKAGTRRKWVFTFSH